MSDPVSKDRGHGRGRDADEERGADRDRKRCRDVDRGLARAVARGRRRRVLRAAGLLTLVAAMGGTMLAPMVRAMAGESSARLAAPTGEPILRLTGRVTNGQAPGEAVFDREMLERLPQRRIVTGTPWAQGQRTYAGPWLRDVLAAAGATGQRLSVRALNDYSAVVPRSDADGLELMLALKVDGQPIRTRDKGPLLLMYPFDQRPDLRNQVYYGRAVLQVASIAVLE